MQNTTNYGLKKPDVTDFYDVGHFNENADIIDVQMKANSDSINGINGNISTINDTMDELSASCRDTREHLGISKNLLKTDFTPKTSTYRNGLTFTVNDDKSITVNGTAEVNTGFEFYEGGSFQRYAVLEVGQYIISGCPQGGSEDTYYLGISLSDDDGGGIRQQIDTGDTMTISVLNDTTYVYSARIFVAKGFTMNNVTFYPMISVEGGAYEPYREVDRVNKLESDVSEIKDSITSKIAKNSTGSVVVVYDDNWVNIVARAFNYTASSGTSDTTTLALPNNVKATGDKYDTGVILNSGWHPTTVHYYACFKQGTTVIDLRCNGSVTDGVILIDHTYPRTAFTITEN